MNHEWNVQYAQISIRRIDCMYLKKKQKSTSIWSTICFDYVGYHIPTHSYSIWQHWAYTIHIYLANVHISRILIDPHGNRIIQLVVIYTGDGQETYFTARSRPMCVCFCIYSFQLIFHRYYWRLSRCTPLLIVVVSAVVVSKCFAHKNSSV